MLGVHLRGDVCTGDTNGNGAKERLVFFEGIPVFVEAQEMIELAELDSFFAEQWCASSDTRPRGRHGEAHSQLLESLHPHK